MGEYQIIPINPKVEIFIEAYGSEFRGSSKIATAHTSNGSGLLNPYFQGIHKLFPYLFFPHYL